MVTSIVAGGAGFLGSHLVDALVKRREAVVVLDNLATGRLANLEAAISSGRTTFIYIDAAITTAALQSALFTAGVRQLDFVYVIDPPREFQSESHRVVEIAQSAESFRPLIDTALKYNARFIFATSREIVADGAVDGSSFLSAEIARRAGIEIVTAAVRERGLDARIAQLATCYGPRDGQPDASSSVATLFDAALQRRPFPIAGNGQQLCSITYVKDAIHGLLLLAGRAPSSSTPVEIVSADEHSILDIARLVARTAGVDFDIQHVPASALTERVQYARSNEAARRGSVPATSLEEGLRATYDWFAKEQRQFV